MDGNAARKREMQLANLSAKMRGRSLPTTDGSSPRDGSSPSMFQRGRAGSFSSNPSPRDRSGSFSAGSPRGSENDSSSPRGTKYDADTKNNISTDPRDYADYAKQVAKDREKALKANQSSGKKRKSQWQTVGSSSGSDSSSSSDSDSEGDKTRKHKKYKKHKVRCAREAPQCGR
jgi:hypothetical protein